MLAIYEGAVKSACRFDLQKIWAAHKTRDSLDGSRART